MKKILALILTLIIPFAFAVAGCVDYNDPLQPDDRPGTDVPLPPGGEDNPPEEDDGKFTVQLVQNNKPFQLDGYTLNAQWRGDDGTFYTAPFNNDGYAEIEGLDGDYQVTLSTLPDGYTYETNKYRSTNDDKKIKIKIEVITPNPDKDGSDLYNNVREIQSTGFYRVRLEGPHSQVCYQYVPRRAGDYSIQSLMDIRANEINPILDVYVGTVGWKPTLGNPSWIQNGGGAENTYTKNFKYDVRLSEDMVGNIYSFCIRTESINSSAFPIDIDFVIEYNGEYTGNVYVPPDEIHAEEEWRTMRDYDASLYDFRYAADLNGRKLDSDLYALNPEDGFYHEYDERTGTFGDILYVKINQDSAVLVTETGTGFMDGQVQIFAMRFYSLKNQQNYDVGAFIGEYAAHVNRDGVYAVTEELRDFLQSYSVSQRLFNDGNGWAETAAGYLSAEEDQWLFNCGVYRRR